MASEFSEIVVAVRMQMDPSFQMGTQQVVTKTREIEREFNTLDLASNKGATGIKNLGMSAAALGSTMALINPEFVGFSAAMNGVGLATSVIGPEIRSLEFTYKELVPRIQAATAAMEAEQLVMTGLVGVMGVGLAAGLIAWKLSTDAQNKKLEDQKKAIENVNKAAQEYLKTTNDLQAAQDKLSGRGQEKKDLELKLRQHGLAIVKAQDALNLPGTTIERTERSYALTSALNEYDKTRAQLAGFDAGTAALQGQVNTLSQTQGKLGLYTVGTPGFYKDTTTESKQTMSSYVPAGTAMQGSLTINLVPGQSYTTTDGGYTIRYNGVQNGGLH